MTIEWRDYWMIQVGQKVLNGHTHNEWYNDERGKE